MFKHTKIGATIGPSCSSIQIISAMAKAGLNFARLNFSHGTYAEHEKLFRNIRAAEKASGEPLAIMQDLGGPKIRVGDLSEAGLTLKTGAEIIFNTKKSTFLSGEIPVSLFGLERLLRRGERMLLDDGRMEVKILRVAGAKIFGQVVEGGKLLSRKGLNFPDSRLGNMPAVTKKDLADAAFGLKLGVDFIAVSFVNNAKDIENLRSYLKRCAKKFKIKAAQPIRLIAKIERHEAVDNIEEIIAAADGIMVARGDLGLEMPAEEVPLVQKRIIDATNRAAKPVIVATQMLDSMQKNRRPTRAEVSDVANAVIDHADALLLTNETATGAYPLLTVKTMDQIIVATEKSAYDDMAMPPQQHNPVDEAVSEISRVLAEEVEAKIILAASFTGDTGRLISRVRPELTILVATADERVLRQLNISWGVQPFILIPCRTIEELVSRAISYIKKNKIAKKGERMIIVAGEPVGQAGKVNLVEVREIS